jgi:hypothetical protein
MAQRPRLFWALLAAGQITMRKDEPVLPARRDFGFALDSLLEEAGFEPLAAITA